MDLYQELILDHSKRPQHAGLREPFDAEAFHINTSCGDEVTLRVRVEPRASDAPDDGPGLDATIADVSYDALGCSISVASTSILATETIGHTAAETLATFEAMRAMLTSKGSDPGDEEVLGDGVALAGVARYPARVKCALLGWSAFTDALARAGVDISSISPTQAARSGHPTQSTPTRRRPRHD